MKTRLRWSLASLGLGLMLVLSPMPLSAEETCAIESFGEAVDDSAAALRSFSAETQPRLKQKLQELREHKGWSEAEYEAKGLALVHDETLDGFDAQAGELLTRIDTLGAPDAADPESASCAKLDELKAASAELMAVMRAKSERLISSIDREIAATPAAAVPPVSVAEPSPATPPGLPVAKTEGAETAPAPAQPDLSPIRRTEKPKPPLEPLEQQETTADTAPPTDTAPAPAATPPAAPPHMASPPSPPTEFPTPPDLAARPPDADAHVEPHGGVGADATGESNWSTTTAQAVVPPSMVRPVPAPERFEDDDLPPGFSPQAPGDPPGMPYTLPDGDDIHGAFDDGEPGYSIDEIREASRGFFGTISSSLASVIEHAFQQSGRPTAYVLGREGGAAFLAGLRYGEGTLYLRSGETQQVYWHGPSIGYDMGADGSRTLFLIYSLQEPDALFRRFTGVDGSAYLVGGVGMTLLRGGNVTMAPIRSGLGLRLGASIGYVRFTPRPTWNPF